MAPSRPPYPLTSIKTTIKTALFPKVIVRLFCQLLLQRHLATCSSSCEFPPVYLILCDCGLLKTTQICYSQSSHDFISTLTRPPCTLQTSPDSDHPSLSSAHYCELKSLSRVRVWLENCDNSNPTNPRNWAQSAAEMLLTWCPNNVCFRPFAMLIWVIYVVIPFTYTCSAKDRHTLWSNDFLLRFLAGRTWKVSFLRLETKSVCMTAFYRESSAMQPNSCVMDSCEWV